MASFPDYLDAQAKGRYDSFWPWFFMEWFKAFPAPEPTADDPMDSEPESDSGPDVPSDSEPDDDGSALIPVKRKQKAGKTKPKKRAKNVCIFYGPTILIIH
jgi:hypothetical protein